MLHLQYADDTLIVCKKSWKNVRAIKEIMHLIELISGQKVNSHKSLLVGVNIQESCMDEVAGRVKLQSWLSTFQVFRPIQVE